MIKPFRSSNRGNNQCRIVVPVRDTWCIDELAIWLAANPQHRSAKLDLVHAVRPKWVDDIPFSALQANRMIDEQEQISAERQREFMALASRLMRRYPELALSVRVLENQFESEAIVEFAAEVESSFILMFCRTKGPIRQFFGANRFSRQIMQSAKCPVHIVQLPRTRKTQLSGRLLRPDSLQT